MVCLLIVLAVPMSLGGIGGIFVFLAAVGTMLGLVGYRRERPPALAVIGLGYSALVLAILAIVAGASLEPLWLCGFVAAVVILVMAEIELLRARNRDTPGEAG